MTRLILSLMVLMMVCGNAFARPSWIDPLDSDYCDTGEGLALVRNVICVDGFPCGYTCRGMAICGDYNQDNACFK